VRHKAKGVIADYRLQHHSPPISRLRRLRRGRRASDTGFTLSGVFRDMADFAVLVLFQKDDLFGHPRFSCLPEGELTGLVLDFDKIRNGPATPNRPHLGAPDFGLTYFRQKWGHWGLRRLTETSPESFRCGR
jgi:hypothetical protein